MKTMLKTIRYTLILLLSAAFCSCEKEDIGKTETVAIAGEWFVTVDAVDADGNIVYEDPFDAGTTLLVTSNTAANNTTEMIIEDTDYNTYYYYGLFYYRAKISCNISTLSFGSDSWADNLKYDEDDWYGRSVKVTDGKIVPNGTVSPSGITTDAISFNLWIDPDGYAEYYGWDHYVVHGYRRTGLAGGTE